MGEQKTIRWGVIGCGDVVETKNGPAFYFAEGSELAGIWNRTASKAQEWTARHGHGRAYDCMEELLADPTIDIVYVATTPNCHLRQAIAVAEAGKHCYLEKPIALSYAEAEEIRAAFAKAGTRCFVAHYRRGMPRYREAKRLIDAGAIGKVRGVQIIRTQRQTAEELLPYEQKPWRVRPEVSGGSHFYEGDAHMLDLVDFLVGPIEDFKLEVSNETGCYPAEDVVALSGKTESRVMVSGLWCYATYKAIDRFLIFGDAGSIEFPYYDNAAPLRLETIAGGAGAQVAHEGAMGVVREGPELVVREVETPSDPYVGLGQVQDIVDELRGIPGRTCKSTLDSAMRTLRITYAAEELINAAKR
ncbi:MAG: Gfo/Idh/MocA family oxidoreductase [Coriobacteriia bacterium]|nr:Gfo/Idh/MocA family oxidoreductase [Coriobacteriia bacterium]